MTRRELTLLGGACAVLAGAFSFVLNLIYYGLMATLWASNPVPEYAVGPLITLAEAFLSLLYTLGLVGVYALLQRRSWLGISGISLSCLSVLAALSPIVFSVLYFFYQGVVNHKRIVRSPGLIFPSLSVDLVGDALLAGAILLLGVAALRAGNLRGCALLLFLLAGLTALKILGNLGPGWIPFVPAVVLVILRGPTWMVLGGVLWVRAPGRTNSAHPPPVRS